MKAASVMGMSNCIYIRAPLILYSGTKFCFDYVFVGELTFFIKPICILIIIIDIPAEKTLTFKK